MRQLIARTLAATLPEVSGVPLLGMSALTGAGAGALLPTAVELYDLWNRRVPTSRLNRWIEQVGRWARLEGRGRQGAGVRGVCAVRHAAVVLASPLGQLGSWAQRR